MRISFFISAWVLLFGSALVTYAQEPSEESIVFRNSSVTFSYPANWDVEIDPVDHAVIVSSDDVDVAIMIDPVGEVCDTCHIGDPQLLLMMLSVYLPEEGYKVLNIERLGVNGRPAARLDYIYLEDEPGFYVALTLSDGSLALLIAYGYPGQTQVADQETIFSIAATIDVPLLTETYRTKSGLAFWIPEGWNVHEDDPGVMVTNSSTATAADELQEGEVGLIIYDSAAFAGPDADTLEGMLGLFAAMMERQSATVSEITEANIGNTPAVRVSISSETFAGSAFAFELAEGYITVVMLFGRTADTAYDDLEPLLLDIAATIVFVE